MLSFHRISPKTQISEQFAARKGINGLFGSEIKIRTQITSCFSEATKKKIAGKKIYI